MREKFMRKKWFGDGPGRRIRNGTVRLNERIVQNCTWFKLVGLWSGESGGGLDHGGYVTIERCQKMVSQSNEVAA